MKRILILICILFIMTGCTGKYNINIKSDGKVEEKFEMTFNNELAKNIDQLFKETMEQYKKNDMYKYYNITKDSSRKKSTIYVSRVFNNIDDLINQSEILPIIFEKTLPTGEYGEYGLMTTGKYYKTSIFSNDLDGESFTNIDIYVKSQNKMVSNNADKYDYSNNTLYWKLDDKKNNFSLDFKFNNSKRYDIIIKDIVKSYWPLVAILLVITLIVTIIVKTIKKQDKINNEI